MFVGRQLAPEWRPLDGILRNLALLVTEKSLCFQCRLARRQARGQIFFVRFEANQ
jgi:hypothetical protein